MSTGAGPWPSRGDPSHPYSRGTLCAKMNRYERTVHSARRLTTPLERTGAKGAGAFRPVSWDEAIERIAVALAGHRAAHGAEAILPYSYGGTMGLVQRNAGHAFFHALGRVPARPHHLLPGQGGRLAGGDGRDAGARTPTRSSPERPRGPLGHQRRGHQRPLRCERAAGAAPAGGEVWLVDTYRTPTAGVADRVFLVRPGSDGALALGMMHVLVREGLAGPGFSASHVAGLRGARTRGAAAVPRRNGGRASPGSRAGGHRGDGPDPTARPGRPSSAWAAGLSRYGNGAMTVRAIACLPGGWWAP